MSDDERPHAVVHCKTWEVIGAGRTLAAAIKSAREPHYSERRCPTCGRGGPDLNERHWRAYPLDLEAFDMLTCGGPFEDALQPRADFTWDVDRALLVWVDFVYCVACAAGERESPKRRGECPPECQHGLIPHDYEWTKPPARAARWRGRATK